MAAFAEETVSALRTVQAFTHESEDRARFDAATERSVATALSRIRSRAMLMVRVVLLGFGAITLSPWVGGSEVIAGRLSGGYLSAFVFCAVIAATSSTGLSELWGEVQRAVGAADRSAELLAEAPTIITPPRPRPLPHPAEGRVQLQDCRVPLLEPP